MLPQPGGSTCVSARVARLGGNQAPGTHRPIATPLHLRPLGSLRVESDCAGESGRAGGDYARWRWRAHLRLCGSQRGFQIVGDARPRRRELRADQRRAISVRMGGYLPQARSRGRCDHASFDINRNSSASRGSGLQPHKDTGERRLAGRERVFTLPESCPGQREEHPRNPAWIRHA